MAYNQYDLATNSLVKTGSLTECYLPLWYYSSGSALGLSTGAVCYAQKGTNGVASSATGTAVKLHTLSANWSPNQKFAFEASFDSSSASYSVNICLYDITAGAIVSSSQVSIVSNTMTLLRSGSFTLIPGHVYGVQLQSTSANPYLSKASLVALLS